MGIKLFFIFILLTISTTTFAKTAYRYIGIKYFNQMFGHLHQRPDVYSTSLTTLACGHPVKIYEIKVTKKNDKNLIQNTAWRRVKVGPYYGYIHISNLSKGRPYCFQDEYPQFFGKISLDITDIYYWGRLQDQYISGKSRVR